MTKPASTPILAAISILPVIVAFFAFAAAMVGANVRAAENSAEVKLLVKFETTVLCALARETSDDDVC
jgi:hypothetical protein